MSRRFKQIHSFDQLNINSEENHIRQTDHARNPALEQFLFRETQLDLPLDFSPFKINEFVFSLNSFIFSISHTFYSVNSIHFEEFVIFTEFPSCFVFITSPQNRRIIPTSNPSLYFDSFQNARNNINQLLNELSQN
jgi:hypothetical protein